MNTHRQNSDTTIAQTKHVRFVDRDGWSFVERIGNTGIVCIVAKTTDGRLVLVEQYRPPVQRPVIELPAGLAGDLDDQADETLQQAAERELLEETGYAASTWRRLVTVASSPGLTDEIVTFFLAEDLQRRSAGGGDASEDIRVHEIPLAEIEDWLSAISSAGSLIDARVYTGLYFLGKVLHG
ncbi:MAG: NUDIX hydrolase [Candidatus Nealsonbacteria bacterium]|nr:NUDIX hydrolase [Candidatus Nealsonbacteria bacterium]